jgi:hypothetical protein
LVRPEWILFLVQLLRRAAEEAENPEQEVPEVRAEAAQRVMQEVLQHQAKEIQEEVLLQAPVVEAEELEQLEQLLPRALAVTAEQVRLIVLPAPVFYMPEAEAVVVLLVVPVVPEAEEMLHLLQLGQEQMV